MANTKSKLDDVQNRTIVLETLRTTGNYELAAKAVGYKASSSLRNYRKTHPKFEILCTNATQSFTLKEDFIRLQNSTSEYLLNKVLDGTISDSAAVQILLYKPPKHSLRMKSRDKRTAIEMVEEALKSELVAHDMHVQMLSTQELVKIGEALAKIAPTGFFLMQMVGRFLDFFESKKETLADDVSHAVMRLLTEYKQHESLELESRQHTLRDGLDVSAVLQD